MNPIHEKTIESLKPELHQLFRTALFALREENASLTKAFIQVPMKFEHFYVNDNKGLAYEVFENIIVYIIFKSWIPLVPTSWRVNYPDSLEKKADLVVYDLKTNKPTYVFEAEWGIDKEIDYYKELSKPEKMLHWPTNLKGKFLIKFWFTEKDRLNKDKHDIKNLNINFVSLTEMYFGLFPTYFRSKGVSKEGYFAMSILNVEENI